MKKSSMLTADIENLDMGMAALVAKKAVLKEIYLVDAKISRDPLTVSPEVLSLEHKCSTEPPWPDKDKNLFLVLCHFRVAAFSDKSPDKLIMKIEASFCTSYVMKSIPDLFFLSDDEPHKTVDSVFEYLATINPISNAWPYWREFVQSMSTRMGFPALTVPLLEIVPKKSVAKEVKSQPVKKKSTRRKKLSA